MKVLMIVHGFVQGVGYRAFVRRMAEKHNVKGYVKNLEDGSVEIYADADSNALLRFEDEIRVNMRNGPVVMHVEEYDETHGMFPRGYSAGEGFVVLH